MLKLIPLIIFPLSFFLIYLGVKNLTGNFSLNNQNTIQIDKEEKEEQEEHNQGSEKVARTLSTEVKQNIIISEEKDEKPIKIENVKNDFEKRKLYKLISQTNDIEKAKKVCSFSKEVKINCLFKKQ